MTPYQKYRLTLYGVIALWSILAIGVVWVEVIRGIASWALPFLIFATIMVAANKPAETPRADRPYLIPQYIRQRIARQIAGNEPPQWQFDQAMNTVNFVCDWVERFENDAKRFT